MLEFVFPKNKDFLMHMQSRTVGIRTFAVNAQRTSPQSTLDSPSHLSAVLSGVCLVFLFPGARSMGSPVPLTCNTSHLLSFLVLIPFLNNRNLLLTILEAGKPKIKVLTDPVSNEGPGWQMAVFRVLTGSEP